MLRSISLTRNYSFVCRFWVHANLFLIVGAFLVNFNVAKANDYCSKILRLKGKADTKVLFEKETLSILEVRGLPESTELITNPQDIIFRYYTEPTTLKEILRNQEIVAGPMPYVVKTMVSTRYFTDLTGVFLTTSDFLGSDIGVPNRKAFVDLKVSQDTAVLKLEEGIYLIPGVGGARPWLLEKYREYKLSGILKTEYREVFETWDKDGVPNPFTTKIKIVRTHFP